MAPAIAIPPSNELAIYDFGTGYSSLAYLKRLPLDVLKIDQSFVSGIGHDQEDAAIVRAIISMAKSLNLSITAEGIETAEQSALLKTWDCDRGQGYYFARPLDATAISELLKQPNSHQRHEGNLPALRPMPSSLRRTIAQF